MRNEAAGFIAFVALSWAALLPAAAQESLLPPGPGRSEVIAACSDCHGLSAVLHNHLTAQEWQDTIAQMQMEGSYVPQQNIAAMVQYLTAHFGPKDAPAAVPSGAAPEAGLGPAAK